MEADIEGFDAVENFFVDFTLTLPAYDELIGDFHVDRDRIAHPGVGSDLWDGDA